MEQTDIVPWVVAAVAILLVFFFCIFLCVNKKTIFRYFRWVVC